MRILGIDPGFAALGWSVIENDFKIVGFGVIKTSPEKPFEERLLAIHRELLELIGLYKPHCAAIEKLYFAKNTKTAMNVAKSIGAVILTLKMAHLDCIEYTPSQVKLAITGFGRASKEQMQTMIKRLFSISEIPKPDDAADALAIALCHSFKQ